GSTPPLSSSSVLFQGGVEPPQSKALRAFSCAVASRRLMGICDGRIEVFERLIIWPLHCNDEAEGLLRRENIMKRSKAMDRMLVVVFDTEPKAYEGKKAQNQMENESSIVVYAYAVVGKNAD